MCGRYYVDDETTMEIERIVQRIDMNLKPYRKEIYPDSDAPVITGTGRRLNADICRWGFPKFKGKGVIFNARAETVLEKSLFRKSLLERRCVIPAKHFYEWDKSKRKIAFFQEEEPIVYMAGFFNTFAGENKFVILTTRANHSMEEVHDRMPVLLRRHELEDWVWDSRKMEDVLYRVPYELKRS